MLALGSSATYNGNLEEEKKTLDRRIEKTIALKIMEELHRGIKGSPLRNNSAVKLCMTAVHCGILPRGSSGYTLEFIRDMPLTKHEISGGRVLRPSYLPENICVAVFEHKDQATAFPSCGSISVTKKTIPQLVSLVEKGEFRAFDGLHCKEDMDDHSLNY